MNINSAKLVYFSPTRTTKRVLAGIARGVQAGRVEELDLTPPAARTREFEEMHDELAIIGAPVYAGRIPIDALQRLGRLEANDTPAVVVVVYGNREYEDALLELKDAVIQVGFKPLAAGAFIGEHSFETDARPVAPGRPDTSDLQEAIEFGKLIRKKMGKIRALDELSLLQVPGNFPYRERLQEPKISPVSQETTCTMCGDCVRVCPTGAITAGDRIMTDRNACILCCACVKSCPTGARVWDEPWIEQVAEWLTTTCRERKEPEIYL
jgi:ferredoxin